MNESNNVSFKEFTASEKEKNLDEIRQRLVDIISPYFTKSNNSVGRFK